MNFNWLKSTTVLGILGGIATVLASPDFLAVIPAKYVPLAGSICAALAFFGIRRRLPAPT